MADVKYKKSFISAFLFVGVVLLVLAFFSGGGVTGFAVSKNSPGDRFFWIGLVFVLISIIILLKHVFKRSY